MFKQYPQIKCSQNNTLFFACINVECLQKCPFICKQSECKCKQQHKNCEYIKWQILMRNISQKRQRIQPSIESQKQKINEVFQNWKIRIEKMENNIIQWLQSLYYNQRQIIFMNLLDKGKYQFINSSIIRSINICFQNYIKQNDLLLKHTNNPEYQNLKSNLSKFEDSLFTLQTLVNDNTNQIYYGQKQYTWSKNFKAKPLIIQSNAVIQTKTSQNFTQNFVLMKNKLENKIYQWTLNLNNIKWIGLGICLKNVIKQKQYGIPTYDQIGHGVYMINSGGYVWSHTDKSINYKILSFQFQSNDQITVIFDGISHTLQFIKNKTQKYKMKVAEKEDNDDYHPCVYMCCQGEVLKLVNHEVKQQQICLKLFE